MKTLSKSATHSLLAAAALLVAAGCDEPVPTEVYADTGGRTEVGNDTEDVGTTDADGDVTDDAETGRTPDIGPDADTGSTDADAGTDSGTDAERDGPPPPECDEDEDGEISEACGGGDCEDDNVRIGPHVSEACDYIDNNCDGRVNEGIECTFYAHTADELYEIDPFRRSAVYVTDVPNLFDFDTAVDGTLWGISPATLWRFDASERGWIEVASLAEFEFEPNGFAINSRGDAFATAANELYAIDLEDGSWEVVGAMGGDFFSSGDCVIDKADTLFMTSKHLDDQDVLIRIDSETGAGTEIGEIGVDRVFGLTAAWGFMFGVTSSGELVEIDSETGAGEVTHVFEGRRWFGAASTPTR